MIRRFEEKVARLVARRCRLLALACAVSLVCPIYCLKDTRIDNSKEVWLDTGGESYSRYVEFLEKYGNEEFIIIAAETEDPYSDECLSIQRELGGRLGVIEEVENVFSVAEAADLLADFRSDWRELVRGRDLFENLLVGRDGKVFGVVAWLKRAEGVESRKRAVERIESAVAESRGGGAEFHLAGSALMHTSLDRGSLKASRRFLPFAIVISVVCLGFVLRSVSAVAAVMCSVGVTTIWTMGLLVAAGKTLNMITVAVPSILFVLSVSGGIHIASRFLSFLSVSGSRGRAIEESLKELIRPVFLSNVTTAVGFASLSVSHMQPVKEFGLFTALGILLSFGFNIAIVPGVLHALHCRGAAHRPAEAHWTAVVGRAMVRNKGTVLGIGVGVFLCSIILLSGAKVESNVLRFFREDSKIRRDYKFIAERLTGCQSVEVDVTGDAAGGAALLKALDRLGESIRGREEVAKVIHYGKLAGAFKDVPMPLFVAGRSGGDNALKPMLSRYRHKEGGLISLRMSVLIRAMSSRDFDSLLDYIEQEASRVFPADSTHVVTGVASLTNESQQSLIDTQIRSLALAGGLILLLIWLFMWSFRAFLAAVLPNLIPIFFVFGIMVVFGIAFDAATVMIASIAIGIAADDTIHFLSHFKSERLGGFGMVDAVSNTLEKAGRAITYTSVVAAGGFIILILAEFQPIQYFGLFTGITMIMAWAGDIFILPACAARLGLWGKRREQ
ncbi:MAG: MMPL family transporter [Sedimentisphaerales bacterium]|nr:MMPL family transporter [Sedimentisphaerales bacterium]